MPKTTRIRHLWLALAVFLVSQPAFAQVAGLDGVVGKVQEFNGWLIALGGALAVTGFIRMCLAVFVGMGNASAAATMLAAGLAVGAAPQIVGFFVG